MFICICPYICLFCHFLFLSEIPCFSLGSFSFCLKNPLEDFFRDGFPGDKKPLSSLLPECVFTTPSFWEVTLGTEFGAGGYGFSISQMLSYCAWTSIVSTKKLAVTLISIFWRWWVFFFFPWLLLGFCLSFSEVLMWCVLSMAFFVFFLFWCCGFWKFISLIIFSSTASWSLSLLLRL